MRVHELAKMLGRTSREVIAILNELGVPVISHANIVDDVAIERLKKYYTARGLWKEEEPEEVVEELEYAKSETGVEEAQTVEVEQEEMIEEAAPASEQETEAPETVEQTPETEIHADEAIKMDEQLSEKAETEGKELQQEQVEETREPAQEHEPASEPESSEPEKEKAFETHERQVPVPEAKEIEQVKPIKDEKVEARPKISRPERKKASKESRRKLPEKEEEKDKEQQPQRKQPSWRSRRSYKEELELAKQPRDYVSVKEKVTHAPYTKSKHPGKMKLIHIAKGKAEQKGASATPPPPPPSKTTRKKVKKAAEKEKKWERKEEKKIEFKPRSGGEAAVLFKEPEIIRIPEGITIRDLAQRLNIKAKSIIQFFLKKGKLLTITTTLSKDDIDALADEIGFIPEYTSIEEDILEKIEYEDREEDRVPRPPVVTVMGHVDHGKTTLLDAIRETNVAEREEGGITQKIGAYQVVHNGRLITFIDTPGHEAFTQMRARGAKATDIVILVVAADDGVMPQTIEAINHARAANTPIVVAVNKIDKPNANVERVYRQLAEVGLLIEEWGGDTIAVSISAKKKQGIDELLEMVLIVADLLELKANPKLPAQGIVLESRLDPKRGKVATVLIQNGTLHEGDQFFAGLSTGKVQAMFNDRGERIRSAGPSTPVEVIRFDELPEAGDMFQVVHDEKMLRKIIQVRREKQREEIQKRQRIRLEDLHKRIEGGEIHEIPIILKANSQGSLEALQKAISELETEKVKINIIHSGVGPITSGDVMLASASNAFIIGFQVRPDHKAREEAEKEKVEIRFYSVIYDMIDELEASIKGALKPTKVENIIGSVEIRRVFKIKDVGKVAGCFVQEGVIRRGSKVRILRDNIVMAEDEVVSLKRFQEDVREVTAGFECGVRLKKSKDFKAGDILEVYEIIEKYD